MTEAVIYDLIEQFERIAGTLEAMNETFKPLFAPAPEPPPQAEKISPHLSLFLEELPKHQYNSLRRKLLPLSIAARVLGISNREFAALTRQGLIKDQSGRYDVLSLLMWLESRSRVGKVS